MINEHTLSGQMNSHTEIYVVESSYLQYTQIHRVSHFNPVEIALTAFYNC